LEPNAYRYDSPAAASASRTWLTAFKSNSSALPHVLAHSGKRVEYFIHYGNVAKFQEHQDDEDELLDEFKQFLSPVAAH
jgi:hypothetical protein